MVNKIFNILITVLTILMLQSNFDLALGQTSGTVTFNVTTNRTYLNYDPRNIVAIWVTDDNGSFVQTLKKRAQTRQQYLYKWISNSNYNIVNAITGATLNPHQSHTVTWDCIDVSGNVVPDGWYRIRCEFTTRNGQGPWTPVDYIRFNKDTASLDMTFPDYNYNNQLAFSGLSLIYVPTINNLEFEYEEKIISGYYLHQNYPNPFNPETNIEVDIAMINPDYSNIKLTIYNSLGQIVRNLYVGKITGGVYKTIWDGHNNQGIQQPSGIYFLELNAGKYRQIRKMVLMQ